MSYPPFFNLDLVSRISEFRPVLFWSDLFIKGKLSMQSVVSSLFLNNLIPFNFLSLNKIKTSGLTKVGPLRIGKNKTPPDWQKYDPSRLAKIRPLRIGKNKTPLDWQNLDPSGLPKTRPLRIGTPPRL